MYSGFLVLTVVVGESTVSLRVFPPGMKGRGGPVDEGARWPSGGVEPNGLGL